MIGTDDVPLHWLRRDPGDRVEQLPGGFGIALPVGEQHAVSPDYEEADGREAGLPDLFVAVDVFGQLDGARKLGELDAALLGIGRAHLGQRHRG